MKKHRMVKSYKSQKGHKKEMEGIPGKGLILALIIFLTVFMGKQVSPGQIKAAGERVFRVLEQSVDLEGVFTRLGESLSDGGGALEGLGEFCVEVFGPREKTMEENLAKTAVFQPMFPSVQSGLLTTELEKKMLMHIDYEGDLDQSVAEREMEEPRTTVGSIVRAAEASERELPEGYTADELSFGELETISPVLGYLNSGFGYRDHPVNGKFSFHSGADISANAGDKIAAFADGVVEYVGEDSTYGLYLQLDHGNEIKSFYAHCQSVCVKKGQTVKMGDTVAIVGSSGRATGPHLHLELKCCGVRVDPAYYIDFL